MFIPVAEVLEATGIIRENLRQSVGSSNTGKNLSESGNVFIFNL